MFESALRFIPLAFAALLPIVNPIGSSLIFLGVVGSASPATYRRLAARIALGMVVFIAVTELLGALILKFFGISMPVLQVAGGLTLAAMGWRTLNARDAPDRRSPPLSEDTGHAMSMSFYPLTFPLTMGPGSIVVILTLSGRAAGPSWMHTVLSHIAIFIGSAMVAVLVYVCYAYAERLKRRVSESVLHGVNRLVSFILLCIGVQILWAGLYALLATVAR